MCDTLATQGVRPLVRTHRDALFTLVERLVSHAGEWQRRLGVVLLTNFAASAADRGRIRRTVASLRSSSDPYVRKAIQWLDRDLAK